MATKELVDRAMLAFEKLDNFSRGITARLYGVQAKEGFDGMRAAFTHASNEQVQEAVDDMEAEI